MLCASFSSRLYLLVPRILFTTINTTATVASEDPKKHSKRNMSRGSTPNRMFTTNYCSITAPLTHSRLKQLLTQSLPSYQTAYPPLKLDANDYKTNKWLQL